MCVIATIARAGSTLLDIGPAATASASRADFQVTYSLEMAASPT
jgi:hypothetical protein